MSGTVYNITCSIEGGQPRPYADAVYHGQIEAGVRLSEAEAREIVAILTQRRSAKRTEAEGLCGYAEFKPLDPPNDFSWPGMPLRANRWRFTINEPYTG